MPPIFELLAQWGGLDDNNMYSTFNMGVGLVIAISKNDVGKALKTIEGMGEVGYVMGSVKRRETWEGDVIIV